MLWSVRDAPATTYFGCMDGIICSVDGLICNGRVVRELEAGLYLVV